MSEPKFTPSPWEVDEPIKSIATGELMYHVKGPNLITDFEDWGFTKADAHLIAAAPELYEALEFLLTCKHGEFCEHYREAEFKAKAALAKARGER